MHLLDGLCSQLVPQGGSSSSKALSSPTVNSLDENLSSLFDYNSVSTVPPKAFELLFGAHRHDVDSEWC